MKPNIIAAGAALVLIVGAFVFTQTKAPEEASVDNVRIEEGVQVVEIAVKGGYRPRTSIAQAGIPTVIRFNTQNTFDCSAAIRIPSLGISKILPQSGATDIDIGSPAQGTLSGSCGMGMYPFEVVFQTDKRI